MACMLVFVVVYTLVSSVVGCTWEVGCNLVSSACMLAV